MKAPSENYNGFYEGERLMSITKADLKELYFKRQDILPFEKFVNRLKEAYNNLEELNQTDLEEQKVKTLLEHIM